MSSPRSNVLVKKREPKPIRPNAIVKPTVWKKQAATRSKPKPPPDQAAYTQLVIKRIEMKRLAIETQIPELTDFSLDMLEPDEALLFVGKRHTGKTVGVDAVMQKFQSHPLEEKRIGSAVVISGSEKANGHFKKRVCTQYVHNEYNAELLKALFDLAEYYSALFEAGKIAKRPAMLCVLDDIGYDHNQRFSETLDKAYMLGRHYKTMMLMTTQYIKAISTKVRGNADWIFVFKLRSPGQIKMIWEAYGGGIRFDVFSAMLHRYTDDYGCLVVNQKTNKSETKFQYFKYTFPFPLQDYRFGSAEEWETAEQIMEEERDKTIEEFEKRAEDMGIELTDKFSTSSTHKPDPWARMFDDVLGKSQPERIASILAFYNKGKQQQQKKRSR